MALLRYSALNSRCPSCEAVRVPQAHGTATGLLLVFHDTVMILIMSGNTVRAGGGGNWVQMREIWSHGDRSRYSFMVLALLRAGSVAVGCRA